MPSSSSSCVGVPAWYRNHWAERYPDPGPAAPRAAVTSGVTGVFVVAVTLAFAAIYP